MNSKFVKIIDFGPRDGLQNEPGLVTTKIKVILINMLADCGLLMTVSDVFELPNCVPQMTDSNEVFANIKRNRDVSYSELTLNMKGLD
jgi:hydroxymethylglutaryl-CoA lyase